MSDKKQSRRSAGDRRPNEVPHHPKLMTTAVVIGALAVVVMAVWFWAIISGQANVFTSAQGAGSAHEISVVHDFGPSFRPVQ